MSQDEKPGFTAAVPDVSAQQEAADKRAQEQRDEAEKKARAASGAFNEANPQKLSAEDELAVCIERLRALFEIKEFQYSEFLEGSRLAEDNVRTTYDEHAHGRRFEIVQTGTNEMFVAKGEVKFQKDMLTAEDALKAAVLVANDIASYPDGIRLTGSDRDKYMLMKAAELLKIDHKLVNPLKPEDFSNTIKEQVDRLFDEMLHAQPAASEQTVDKGLTPEQAADIRKGAETIDDVVFKDVTPKPAENNETTPPKQLSGPKEKPVIILPYNPSPA